MVDTKREGGVSYVLKLLPNPSYPYCILCTQGLPWLLHSRLFLSHLEGIWEQSYLRFIPYCTVSLPLVLRTPKHDVVPSLPDYPFEEKAFPAMCVCGVCVDEDEQGRI